MLFLAKKETWYFPFINSNKILKQILLCFVLFSVIIVYNSKIKQKYMSQRPDDKYYVLPAGGGGG